jgi:hypothetical protein
MTSGHRHTYADRPHPEYVVLDIGGECGALILHTDPGLHGVEVEISPRGRDADRSHKEVLEREINGRPAYTAVFESLASGEYTLWTHGEPRSRGVRIEAGAIAEVDWRDTTAGDLKAAGQ